MKIKKRAIKSIVLVLVGIIVSTPILGSSYAMESRLDESVINTVEVENIESRLKQEGIEGVELVNMPKLRAIQKTIDFETEEEFVSFIKKFKAEDSIDNDLSQSRIASSGKLKWYAPFSGWGATGIANWKNIWFNYDYKKNSKGEKLINKVSNITSDITGIQIAVSWHQKQAKYSIAKDKKSCKFTIDGYYLLGVTIGGTPIGAKISNTWNRTFNAN